ncbi:MAG: hypothetical protein AAF481_08140 [Acidobacteriota bacterium]
MARSVAALAVFFFVGSLAQLAYLQWHLTRESPNILTEIEPELLPPGQVEIAALLESDVVARRYRLASMQMMGQLWIRYLGFVTGMIMAIIGAVFVLGKLREEDTRVQAEASPFKMSIATASPGIILALVGAGLMMATVLTKQRSTVEDAAIYLLRLPPSDASNGTELADQLDAIRARRAGESTAGIKSDDLREE